MRGEEVRHNARKEKRNGASCLKLAMKPGVYLIIISIAGAVLADTFVFEVDTILVCFFSFIFL